MICRRARRSTRSPWHPYFTWKSFAELYNLLDIVVETDFLDEKIFARTAVAKAQTGLEILRNTYRLRYEQDPNGQWQGYTDTDKARAWGLSEWGLRAYQAAYFDWATANSLVPWNAETNGVSLDESSMQLNRIRAPVDVRTRRGGLRLCWPDAGGGDRRGGWRY